MGFLSPKCIFFAHNPSDTLETSPHISVTGIKPDRRPKHWTLPVCLYCKGSTTAKWNFVYDNLFQSSYFWSVLKLFFNLKMVREDRRKSRSAKKRKRRGFLAIDRRRKLASLGIVLWLWTRMSVVCLLLATSQCLIYLLITRVFHLRNCWRVPSKNSRAGEEFWPENMRKTSA